MILRHGADGQYEIYDIGSNSLLAAYQLGTVGTDWQFVSLGSFRQRTSLSAVCFTPTSTSTAPLMARSLVS